MIHIPLIVMYFLPLAEWIDWLSQIFLDDVLELR